jgi:RND family efflux transporter MFP subunit
MNTTNSSEDQLRREIDELRRQLEEQRRLSGHPTETKRPSFGTLAAVVLMVAALAVAGYFFGYKPRQQREAVLAAESHSAGATLPLVNVQTVSRSATESSLVLPGNIQAVTEAPILARASGYIKKRSVDIGDRVKSGQVLAEIEAPELQQQIRQALATVDQANAAIQQAQASLEQGRSNLHLAQVTKDRWQKLFDKGVVSRQENDTYQAQYQAQESNVQALEKAVTAAQSNAAAAQANVARLRELQGYQTVRAPFAGVITLRNVDDGVLVNEGQTLLFRIAQVDRLRTYLNVPQSDAENIHVGQTATLQVSDLGGRTLTGSVTRTANALDPSSRTLLVEVQVANPNGTLMPGMYTQVDLAVPRKSPPLTIPGDTLVIRGDGPQVAVISRDGTVHYQRIKLGRDFGDHLEVLEGLEEGQWVAVNPGDEVREGATVKPQVAQKKQ